MKYRAVPPAPPVASTPAYLMTSRAGVTGPREFLDRFRTGPRPLDTEPPQERRRGIFRQIPIVLTVRGEGAHIWGQPESQAGRDWPGYLWISPGNWRRRGPGAPPVASSPKTGQGPMAPQPPEHLADPMKYRAGADQPEPHGTHGGGGARGPKAPRTIFA